MKNKEKYFISLMHAEKLETFAQGVKESIIRAVEKIEKPNDIEREKVDLKSIKTECSYDAYSGQIVIEVTADSKTVPLPYENLLKNYLDLKNQIEKDGEQE